MNIARNIRFPGYYVKYAGVRELTDGGSPKQDHSRLDPVVVHKHRKMQFGLSAKTYITCATCDS